MPAVSLPPFKISSDTLSKSPQQMVEQTFNELSQWFAGLLNPLENEFKRGTDNASRTDTMLRLSKLAGEVSGMKDTLEGFINVDLKPKPAICLPDYDLPSDATTLKDKDTPVEKRLKPPFMIAKAFQGLSPWFQSFFPRIKPYYLKGVQCGEEPEETKYKLKGFVRVVNTMMNLLLNFINKEIENREKGTSLSAGDEDSQEAIPIPADVGVEVVEQLLDVKISDDALPPVEENPEIELGPKDD